MSVWRVLAPLMVLLLVIGMVSIVAVSGVFEGLQREPAAPPSTVETLELPLVSGPATETSSTPGVDEVTGGEPASAEPSD